MGERLELQAERRDDGVHLLAPEVGTFTCAVARGRVLTPGAPAGVLRALGVPRELVVPAGVTGRVASDRPERVRAPVGYGETLYVLEPLAASDTQVEEAATSAAGGGAPAFVAPYSGRFWHRPAPEDPAFVSAGDVIDEGQTLGLIEVMKTFTHVHYSGGGVLPPRARITRVLAQDGEEVDEGQPLFEVETVS